MSTRSHQGCWTCKRRHRRCDNARPTCANCACHGVECEGYEVRLRWGAGIASRGRFMGADKPLEENVPARPKGRQRDISKQKKMQETQSNAGPHGLSGDPQITAQERPDPWSPKAARAEHDARLFNEFLTHGINVLHSTNAEDTMLRPRLPRLMEESTCLYAVCLAFQISLSTTHTAVFFEYFDMALREFRSELLRSKTLSDGTLTAGLLLCSIGLMHGLPWTMHLEGVYNILQSHGDPHGTATPSPFRIHLLEVMGVMDLACFSVGRQTQCIGIWRRYCQPVCSRLGVEPVSGLPRTLLDLFAGIGFDTTEQSFWDWPGETSSFMKFYLWEAHRLAGILCIRRHIQPNKLSSGELPGFSAWRHPPTIPAETTVLVGRMLANLDALRLAFAERPDEDAFIKNAVLFPIFVAGIQITVLCQHPEWQATLRRCALGSRQDDVVFDLLGDLWKRNDPDLNVDDLARSRGIEMGLI
ncbi:hypothetical protein N7492_005637 [Penicillium capsulatum]|uniref:Zn(2)-C6 fungal-type domain-containing protein n=1 Tax=Penicillium capsulatum TaxID=69766 RepID=A0A9W9IBW2_9EURO|nr:hypothetical protein N7492_005637 [Penicillium capsulatum]KAJ6135265.1 hypothetical protein N7512_000425 [Penicillium capsulatum]